MNGWFFPSASGCGAEGISDAGLETFKGEPIRSMAREVCQNSLDARRQNDRPLRIEFERLLIKTSDFPGTEELRKTLLKCQEFWKNVNDKRQLTFIKRAIETISDDKIFILRISDYNTTGLKGAFSKQNITPWKSLVCGNAYSVKSSDTSGGSYGIGKAAAFAVSKLQTVFYRTFDIDNCRAVQGVAHIPSFFNENAPKGLDKTTRPIGYYGSKPLPKINELDELNMRKEYGTDLFILGFDSFSDKGREWKDEVIIEILNNFIYSIYSNKMEVIVDGVHINKNTAYDHIDRLMPTTKHVKSFYDVINTPTSQETLMCENKNFHNLGTLNLRILYSPEANKKVLVVRESGMKITDITNLPKGISFSGFLELQGKELNKFFREMENPQHNKWEPNRHDNPKMAKTYKDDLEKWVRDCIGEKIKEISGTEIDVDTSRYFLDTNGNLSNEEKKENIIDTVKNIEIRQDTSSSRTFKIKDVNNNVGKASKNRTLRGTIDDKGSFVGHRSRTGTSSGGQATGRKGSADEYGEDTLYYQTYEIEVSARIIKRPNGLNKLIFRTDEYVNRGELEIVTVGENGKPLQLVVKNANGVDVSAFSEDGHIVIIDVDKNVKHTIEFEIYGDKSYAMGVRAYGD